MSNHAERTYRNRAWFARRIAEKRTSKHIARMAQVSSATISKWKAFHGFVESKRGGRDYLSMVARSTYANRTWLEEKIASGMSTTEIIDAVEVETRVRIVKETIHLWRFRLNLKRRRPRHSKIAQQTYANRDWLTERMTEGLSDHEIIALIDPAPTIATIRKWRTHFNLLRPKSPHPINEARRKSFGEWLGPKLASLPLSKFEQVLLKRYYGIDGPVETVRAIKKSTDFTPQWIHRCICLVLGKIIAIRGSEVTKKFPEIRKYRHTTSKRFLASHAKRRK